MNGRADTALMNGFSKYFGKAVAADANAQYSPSGLKLGFSGHPCPEIAVFQAKY